MKVSQDIEVGSPVRPKSDESGATPGIVKRIFITDGVTWVVVRWGNASRDMIVDPDVIAPLIDRMELTTPVSSTTFKEGDHVTYGTDPTVGIVKGIENSVWVEFSPGSCPTECTPSELHRASPLLCTFPPGGCLRDKGHHGPCKPRDLRERCIKSSTRNTQCFSLEGHDDECDFYGTPNATPEPKP